jgi:hypothetical protein
MKHSTQEDRASPRRHILRYGRFGLFLQQIEVVQQQTGTRSHEFGTGLIALGDQKEDIMKRTAIVTGASPGIGRAVAKRLAHDGFAVVVNYLTNSAEAENVVAEIKRTGGDAISIKADSIATTRQGRSYFPQRRLWAASVPGPVSLARPRAQPSLPQNEVAGNFCAGKLKAQTRG